MNCKFCNAEMEEGVTLCPACGKENAEEVTETAEEVTEAVEVTEQEEVTEAAAEEETPKKKHSLWVTILAIIGGIALAAVLVGAVLYGAGVFDGKSAAGSYTVDDAAAEKARDTVIATVGDAELTNSELQVYYWQAVSEFTEYYGYYMDISTLGLDLEKPLDQQYYSEEEGITWQEYFLDNALNTWHRYAALSMVAKAEGFQIDEASRSYLDSIPEQLETMAVSYGYTSAEEMLQEDLSNACDKAGYMRFMELNYYAGQYFDNVYATLEPSMDEIQLYYSQNMESLASMGIADDGSRTVDVRHILVCPQGGTENEDGETVYSDAEWEACRVKAQDLLDQWKSESGTEEGFAQYAMEHTEDPGSQATGGLYTDVYVGQMVEPFEDWCFDQSRQYGDIGLVQTNYGYHIMYFVAEEDVWVSNVRSTIVNERSTEMVNEAVAKYPMDINEKKIVLGEATA